MSNYSATRGSRCRPWRYHIWQFSSRPGTYAHSKARARSSRRHTFICFAPPQFLPRQHTKQTTACVLFIAEGFFHAATQNPLGASAKSPCARHLIDLVLKTPAHTQHAMTLAHTTYAKIYDATRALNNRRRKAMLQYISTIST